MTSVRFAKIGTIIRGRDGRYDIGPFPDIGGPFETATAFFEAWAAHAKFPMSMDKILKSMNGGPVKDILASITEFPLQVGAMASFLSSSDRGPFPVSHTDFLHSNIVIDQKYKILGVINWEGACTLPWELVEFPIFLETVPVPMDAPWNYNEFGEPLEQDTRRKWQERKDYVKMVAKVESTKQSDHKLSTTLGDQSLQNLAYAMRVYLNPGKLGFYSKVLEQYKKDLM
jgi:hypothetical protein